jgi:hypothetical protein
MRAFFILGLQCFCTVVVAAQQSPAISGDHQPAAQEQVTQTTSPATIAYPCVVVCCPAVPCSVPYYCVCPPVVCPVITYYPVPYPTATCGTPSSATTPGMATGSPTDSSTSPPPEPHPPITQPADKGSSAGSNSGPSPPLDETQVEYKVRAILDLLGVEFNYKPLRDAFECDVLAVGPIQIDAVGNDYWLPAGPPADLRAKGEKWKDVTQAIVKALGPASPTPSPSPSVALRVTIPAADGSPAVQYRILMLFNQNSMRLFRDGKQIGTHTIQDDGKWGAMLKDLGAAPTPTTSSSK